MNYDFSGHSHQRNDQFDPYEVLELPRDADMHSIKQCFRKLTRVYHPDRNRHNPKYDGGQHYARICAAYEVLSDSRKRAAYDQQNAPHWNTLREASQSQAPAIPKSATFEAKQSFGDNDRAAFNRAFEESRKRTPNDHGYGDQMMGRATEQDVKRGRSIDTPRNVFGSTQVSGAAFNDRFESELKSTRQQRQQSAMMERNGEPMGYHIGGGGGAAFADISYYDGLIIDAERQDYSKLDENTGLNYSDYMSGFTTITEQLPEDHEYFKADGKNLEKYYNERLSQVSGDVDRGHSLSFNQSEALLTQQRERELAAEQERNRQVVLKYRDHYASDDLLPPSGPQPQPQSQRNPGGGGQHQYGSEQQQQQRHQQHRYEEAPHRYEAPRGVVGPAPQMQPRAAPGTAGVAINNRMLDRQLDMIRGPPRKY